MIKRIWLGQRLSDGLLFSSKLSEFEAYFTGEGIIANQLPANCFSLDTKGISPRVKYKWTSDDIKIIIDVFEQKLKKFLDKGSVLLPYYLPNELIFNLCNKQTLLNEKIFHCKLVRSLQMFLMDQANIVTPKWIVPQHLSWENLVNTIGCPFILQFDNTSSGMGTYLIESKDDYLSFITRYGDADIATQYIQNGYSCSTHIWITSNDIQIASPSVQIIEKEFLIRNNSIQTFSYRGNDFGLYASKIGKSPHIEEQLLRIGSIYQKAGIWGLIGVDYIVKDGKFYYNETNFRLQNSTSLLSFLQPKDNNIVSLMIGKQKKLAEVKTGFQYFKTLNVSKLVSGYYSYDGKFISNFDDSYTIDSLDKYLVFASSVREGVQNVRIIGLGTACIEFGEIGTNVTKFMERLENIYG